MEQNKIAQQWSKMVLKDVSFVNLMQHRIYNVLIVANPYDAFMLEDDGRVDEKVFNEYSSLGLRYPPLFRQVSTTEEVAEVLRTTNIDLVICMPGTADNDAFNVARAVKGKFPDIPCVVLTPFSHGIARRMEHEDMSIFDYVFCWLGNTNLILSIIKLIEDRMNLDHDIEEAGVQMILLVEDSIRFYSSILPSLYSYILAQSQRFATEALNPHSKTLRMRGRPKVVLARNQAEAMYIYNRYRDNILGVISDCRFPMFGSFGNEHHRGDEDGGLRGYENSAETESNLISRTPASPHPRTSTSPKDGETVADAGFLLLEYIHRDNPFIPLIMQSSETENRVRAEREGYKFIDKNSKKMLIDLREELEEHFGFGDFIFRDPHTKAEVKRIRNLKELQDNIFSIPSESLLYHTSRNHISRWLCARAIFPVSQFLKNITLKEVQDVDAHRQIIFDAIVKYRHMKNIGVVALFNREQFDSYSHFARIGDGSLGGKGRGLAFLDDIIKRHPEFNQFDGVRVSIPKTVVLCTDVFDEFMDSNNLYQIALSDRPDEEILQHFLRAQLPDKYIADFFAFFEATKKPIAVRSSSLLEDSHYQPFAGVYSTYMIPYAEDKYYMLRMLANAIKCVYASVFFKDSKAYMTATSNVIDQEKMAVVLQEVVGRQYGDYYYPTISGVLRSLNYYPIEDETSEEGVASLALGLGKYIVDGGQTLRVSPFHPQKVLQMSEMHIALRQTQTQFYALHAKNDKQEELDFTTDDGFNIATLPVKEAESHGSLKYITSTYDAMNQIIREGFYPGGRKIISLCGVLKHGVFPLPELLQMSMKYGSEGMRRPVEIELACNISDKRRDDGNGVEGEMYLLQIRPIVDSKQELAQDLSQIADDRCLLRSHSSLGHGVSQDVTDVVYIKADDDFSAAENPIITQEIEEINQRFLDAGKNYVLVGPGRWGSSDYWLGIPVKWAQISAARVIVECGLKGYRVDPSQGTHFFQNLTSMGVGYFTINPYRQDGLFNKAVLDAMPAVEETAHVRHVCFESPLTILMDGVKQEGVVLLPEP